MIDSVRTSVCVVGGGPAGLLLALLLAKRGVEVVVLEGHATFERAFRGEVLQPSTVRLLDRLAPLLRRAAAAARPRVFVSRGMTARAIDDGAGDLMLS